MLLEKKIPISYIINKVKFDIVYVLIVTILVTVLTLKFEHALPEIPLTIPVFLGTSISILLSFKLNQSYDRWWEARKIWGAIVNDSRSFVIQIKTLMPIDDESVITRMANRQIAWCYVLGQQLRGAELANTLKKYLLEEDIEFLKKHNNKALGILLLNGQELKLLKEKYDFDILIQLQLDNTLVRLCDAQGKAERIKSTVFPVTYRMFLHFIIYLFVITLSISLENLAGYFEIPLLLVISMAFFLLEKSATHMQNPFENKPTDTAVTTIATTIETNIRQMMGEHYTPETSTKSTFYQL